MWARWEALAETGSGQESTSVLAFQRIMYTSQVSPKTARSTALCFFSILEGLAYCTEYLEYVSLRVSSSCWAPGLSWIPGYILIFHPGSDTMKQCKTCIISLKAHCNSQFVAWHKDFVLHALNMTWEDKGSQMYMDLSVLLTQSSSWNELFWEFFGGKKLVQSGALGEITPHYKGEQWIFSLGWILSLQDKTFPVVLYCIQAEVLPLSLELSWQEVGCTEEDNRIAKGCPCNKRKNWRGQGRADNDTRVFLFHRLHKFLLAPELCRCGRWKGGFTNSVIPLASRFGVTCTFPSCDFAQRRYPVVYLSVTFCFLPIFPLLTEEIKSYSWLIICHWWMSFDWHPYSRGKKGLCYAEYMVCNLLFLPWHFSSAFLLWKRNPIATAWFFSCFSDVIFLRIPSYESVNKVCSWWHFASSVTALYALMN